MQVRFWFDIYNRLASCSSNDEEREIASLISNTRARFRALAAPDRTTDWSKFSFRMIHSVIDQKWPQRFFISYLTTQSKAFIYLRRVWERCFSRLSRPPKSLLVVFFPGKEDVLRGVGGASIRLGSSQIASDHSKTADSNNLLHKLRFAKG